MREVVRIGDFEVRDVRREEEEYRFEEKGVIIVIFRNIGALAGCEACVLYAAKAVLRKGDAMLIAPLLMRAMAKPVGSRIN